MKGLMDRLCCLLVAVGLAMLVCPAMAGAEDVDVGTTYVVQITDEVLNIRAQPTLKGEIIGWLDLGDQVKATGYQDGWTQIKASVEAGSGWVKSEYLTMTGEDVGAYQNTSNGRVRLRDGVAGEKIGWIETGAVVDVSAWATDADGEKWAFIGTGYVMGRYFGMVE